MLSSNRRNGIWIALVALLAVLGVAGGAPTKGAAEPAAPAAPAPWSGPANISGSSTRSNYPGVAGRPNGSAGMVWSESDPADDDPTTEWGADNQAPNSIWGDFDEIVRGGKLGTGNSTAAHGPDGKLHAAWYFQGGSGQTSYIMYAVNNGNGWVNARPIDQTRINGLKEIALTVGPNGRVHMLFGRHGQALYYLYTDDGINWSNLIDVHVDSARETLAIGVSSSGQVIALYVDLAQAQHVMAKFLQPNDTWSAAQQVSSGTVLDRHFPSVAPDANGGFRVAWDQGNPAWEQSDGVDPTDIYYREWSPTGGWSPFIKQITNNEGDSVRPNVMVDGAGQTHIVYADWSRRGRGNFTAYEVVGQGTNFSSPTWLLPEWGVDGFAKDPDADLNNGRIHLAFDSNISGPNKDVFYMTRPVAPPETPTPTSSPTNTPTPTNTPVPPTATNGPGCIISDVCPGDYWFTPVQHLIALGAISGYADNTFRPFNNTTRSQLTKIVVVARDWQLGANGGPHFSDVPPNNPFYLYIETAFAHGVISGYGDGTFRPFDNVTRGQIAKVVVAAQGWPLLNPSRPTFSDVPTDNPFYRFIETASAYGIISGYADHTFRWQNNATRGQIAKVVDVARTAPSPTRTREATATRTKTATRTATKTKTPTRTPTRTRTPVH